MKLYRDQRGGEFKYLCKTRRRFHLITVDIEGFTEVLFYNMDMDEVISNILRLAAEEVTVNIGCSSREGISRLQEIFKGSDVRINFEDGAKVTPDNFMYVQISGHVSFNLKLSNLSDFFNTIVELRKENFRAFYYDRNDTLFGNLVVK